MLAPDATPVPGAAATLTRSINTPIPTPIRTASPAAAPSPSPRVAVPGSPGPSTTAEQVLSDADVTNVQNRLNQALTGPDLPGVENLLLDHVSLSTPAGGSVMDASEAASWLRAHASPNVKITQIEAGTQDVSVQAQSDGWATTDPLQTGRITFSLRRYDANGRQDQSGGGEWKIDVIEAE